MCVCFVSKATLGSRPVLPMLHTLRNAMGTLGKRSGREGSRVVCAVRPAAWSRARGPPAASLSTVPWEQAMTQTTESLEAKGPFPSLYLLFSLQQRCLKGSVLPTCQAPLVPNGDHRKTDGDIRQAVQGWGMLGSPCPYLGLWGSL